MKTVLIPIRPEWITKIISRGKNIEVRKTRPKLKTPFKCFIYCTKPRLEHEDFFILDAGTESARAFYGGGKVIGEFICDRIFDIEFEEGEGYNESYTPLGFSDGLDDETFDAYLNGKQGYGWHISALKIYDEPKKLTTFRRPCSNDFYCETCAMHTYKAPYCGNAALDIRRPPQSWCYVVAREANEQ